MNKNTKTAKKWTAIIRTKRRTRRTKNKRTEGKTDEEKEQQQEIGEEETEVLEERYLCGLE